MFQIVGAIIGLAICGFLLIYLIVGVAYAIRGMVNAHEKYSNEGHPILATIWLLYGLAVIGGFIAFFARNPPAANSSQSDDLILMVIAVVFIIVAIPVLLMWIGGWLDARRDRRDRDRRINKDEE